MLSSFVLLLTLIGHHRVFISHIISLYSGDMFICLIWLNFLLLFVNQSQPVHVVDHSPKFLLNKMFPFLVIDCVLFYFDWWNKWYKNIFPCHVVLSPKVIKLQIRPILFGRIWYATQILLPKLAQWYFATQILALRTCPMIFCHPNLPNDILQLKFWLSKLAQWYFATQIFPVCHVL